MEPSSQIKVEVECSGLLHIEGLEKGGYIEVKEGATIEDLLQRLHVARDHQKFVTAFINGQEKSRFTPLHENDKITFLLPIGGG
ncbi:MAG: MoaD/ThiS family protein [Bacteroidota bacterium]